MSQIKIQCRGCNQELSLPASAAGKHARCPKCEMVFEVPDTSSVVVASVPPTNPYSSHPFNESTKPDSDLKSGLSKTTSRYDDENPPPLGLVTIPLYISAVFYFLIGLAAIAFLVFVGGNGEAVPVILFAVWGLSALFCFALAGFIVFFTGKLRRRKKWAWITAIAFGALYTPSAFIFLGVPILIGALNPEVQAWFNTD